MEEYCVVIVTCEDREEAAVIAKTVVEKHLAACASLIPMVQSFFWWKDALEVSEESMLLIKTRMNAFDALKEEIRRLHRYTVPEIIALPIKAGHKDYLDWIGKEVHE